MNKVKWSNVMREPGSKFIRRPYAAHCRQRGRWVQGPWGGEKNARGLERGEDELEAERLLLQVPWGLCQSGARVWVYWSAQ